MASIDLLGLLGWWFLPNLASGYLQAILYAVFIRAGEPKPASGSPRYQRDRKRIHVVVILAYLLYTVYEADYQLRRAGNFYEALSVPFDVDDKALQSRFRRLTVQYHPDKATGPDKERIEAVYVHLKLARDTLIDPAKRFAYDRFGTDSLQWRGCKTVRDYVLTGLQNLAMYYVGSGVVLIVLSVLGYLQSGKFWRYLLVAGLCLVELHAMTRPVFPLLLTKVVNPFCLTTNIHPPMLPFQLLMLLRKLSLTLFIAMAQLAPLLRNPQAAAPGDGIAPQVLDRLDALSNLAEQETTRLMGLELSPFANEPPAQRDLRAGLKEWLVQNTVRNDSEVHRAMETVLRRRREIVASTEA